jgi:hypothetical protein
MLSAFLLKNSDYFMTKLKWALKTGKVTLAAASLHPYVLVRYNPSVDDIVI